MGIRGRLLLLAAGIAVPLVVVGALDLLNMWRLSRSQLNDSIQQQVELASVALERWLDDQKKALDAIAALAGDKDTRTPIIREHLENVLRTRPFWLDLRITNAAGTTLMSQPSRRDTLPNALTDYLVSEMRERKLERFEMGSHREAAAADLVGISRRSIACITPFHARIST